MNLFSKKADFEEVKKYDDFLKFHAERFEHGARDDVARASYVFLKQREGQHDNNSRN